MGLVAWRVQRAVTVPVCQLLCASSDCLAAEIYLIAIKQLQMPKGLRQQLQFEKLTRRLA